MPGKPSTDDDLVQLATRIPKPLHRRMKLFCIERDRSVMEFIAEALREKLDGGPVKVVVAVLASLEMVAV